MIIIIFKKPKVLLKLRKKEICLCGGPAVHEKSQNPYGGEANSIDMYKLSL